MRTDISTITKDGIDAECILGNLRKDDCIRLAIPFGTALNGTINDAPTGVTNGFVRFLVNTSFMDAFNDGDCVCLYYSLVNCPQPPAL